MNTDKPVCYYCGKPVCQCQMSNPPASRVCHECVKKIRKERAQANREAKKSI